MFGRIFTTHLLAGAGLALVLGVGSTAEGPVTEPVTEGSRAEPVALGMRWRNWCGSREK